MTVMQAAHAIRRQDKGISMGDALSYAWECKRRYDDLCEYADNLTREAHFKATQERAKAKRFLDDLHAATPARSATTREGGWAVQFQTPTVKEFA